MLSKADDYPIHQTPDPIAFAQSDRNFYDRYFFNGQSIDGEIFFAMALGVYPNLNIMDAAFGVRIGDVQYNIRASRHLGMERMDTHVGPIRIEVIEPLKQLRIVIEDDAHDIAADLIFDGRTAPVEEPRITRRNGPRVIQDFTRLTQHGRYSGFIRAGGQEIAIEPARVGGVRDRSWGVRQVGLRDPQIQVPPQDPQFHWLWITAQFEDRSILFYLNEDRAGVAWNRGMVVMHDDGEVDHIAGATIEVGFHTGTRWPARASITGPAGLAIKVEIGARFFMTGIGYMDPEWSHGINKGPLAVGYDELRGAEIEYAMPHIYTQCFARMTMTLPGGGIGHGFGAMEVLSMGPHERLGFVEMFDGR